MSPRQHLHAVHVAHAEHCEACSKCHSGLAALNAELADDTIVSSPIQSAIHKKISEAHLAAANVQGAMAQKHRAWASELMPTEKSAGSDFDLLKTLTGTEV